MMRQFVNRYKRFFSNSLFNTIILIYAIVVRIFRISRFKIYSDSFKFLLIARATYEGKWISDYYHGYADFQGSSFISNYKWLFGILVGISTRILTYFKVASTKELFENVANFWAILPSVLSGVLLYIFCSKMVEKRLISEKKLPLLAMILYLLSGVQILWSGYINTDCLSAFLLLLFIFLYEFHNNKMVFIFVLAVLLFKTRPEMVVVPAIYLLYDILDEILAKVANSEKFLLFRKYQSVVLLILFGIVYLYNVAFSAIFTRNFWGDSALWILMGPLVLLMIIQQIKQLKDANYHLDSFALGFTSKLLLSSAALTVIYYMFDRNMSHYISNLLPLLIIILIMGLNNVICTYWSKLKIYIRIMLNIALLSLFAVQLIYPWIYYKYPGYDYNTEVAKYVIDYARENDIHQIYVCQEEGFLWEDFDNDYIIEKISRESFENLVNNAIYVKDNSVRLDNCYWNESVLRKVYETKTNANFWINDYQEPGWFEIYVK